MTTTKPQLDGMSPTQPSERLALRFWGLALAMLVVNVYGSLVPLDFQPMPLESAWARFFNLTSFDPTWVAARADWAITGVQYALMAFLFAGALSVGRSPAFGWLSILVVIPQCCFLGVLVEFIQVYFPPRTVSSNDLAIVVLGSTLGGVGWAALGSWLVGRLAATFQPGLGLPDRARAAAPLALGLFLILSWLPFDVVSGPSELADRLGGPQIRFGLIPRVDTSLLRFALSLGMVLAIHFGLGCFLGVADSSPGRRSGVRFLRLGLLLTVVAESGQALIHSRWFDTADILVGVVGLVMGWYEGTLLARFSQTLSKRVGLPVQVADLLSTRWCWALVVGWAILLIGLGALPGLSTRVGDAGVQTPTIQVVPFADYYWGSKYQAITQVLLKGGLFVPLGIALGLGLGSGRGGLAVGLSFGVGLLVASALEASQYWWGTGSPSASDLVVQVFGAMLGAWTATLLTSVTLTWPTRAQC